MSLVLAAIFGFIAVACGAFGAHGLKNTLDAYALDVWKTAVLYQMFHALALLALGVLELQLKMDFFWTRAGFAVGIVIFSGSLYVLALSGIKWLGAITPIGGVLFLLSWALLGYECFRLTRSA